MLVSPEKKYSEYLTGVDFSDPDSVLEKITYICNDSKCNIPSLKLFLIGYLLNSNKEDYIQILKLKINQLSSEVKKKTECLEKIKGTYHSPKRSMS